MFPLATAVVPYKKSNRAAAPVPFVGCAVAEPGGDQLQPVVVMRVVVERRVRAEPLFDHLPGGVVADRVGVGVRRTAQVAAEAGEPARLIIAVIDSAARGVGQSLDVAGQIVGVLNGISGLPNRVPARSAAAS